MELILPLLLLINIIIRCQSRHSCYDNSNKPKKCIPKFENIVYKRLFTATNTCGDPPIEYCIRSEDFSFIITQKCYVCQANSHNVKYLTDDESNNVTNPTWWQSETMKQLLTYKSNASPAILDSVNLTINLGKTFEVTYVRIRFQSPAPESYAIYKKTNKTTNWIPYHYFSASCEATYDLLSDEMIKDKNEIKAFCSSDSSDIIPLTGNTAIFSTLEGIAIDFYESVHLKEWTTATDIRISLNRLNTFGDEDLYEDAQNGYFYAISDIAIGGNCECNGHANECLSDKNGDLKCVCQHNTEGVDCEKCKPFFKDVAWRPATYTSGFECVECNCNGYSDECYYDHELYLRTGHGGHCINCGDNRTGFNCGECKFGFYRTESRDECIDCECDPTGSESLQCNSSGKCKCKSGVAGDKCDKCAPNYYNLTVTGCQECTCNTAGSYDSPPRCDQTNGTCRCKPHVENKNCDKCKPGYFNLQESIYGCFQCFCFGHSSECTGSTNHKVVNISLPKESNLKLSNPDLKFIYDEETDTFMVKNEKNIQINEAVYLSLPNEFLGNKRLSYNGDLIIGIKLNNLHDFVRINRVKDLVIENSHENLEISTPIRLSSRMENHYFKLSDTFNWSPRFHIDQFQRLLSNITSIKLRLNYNTKIEDTLISNIVLQEAKIIDNININEETATFIELCKCPTGHAGQFCDQCTSGYRRENPNLKSFSRCIPSNCNNHSATCNQMNCKCDCIHHTSGDNCEKCERGYYGNALVGTQDDCKKCPCSNNGPCVEIYNYQENKNDIVCLGCPIGTHGNLCESCESGYLMKTPSEAECELLYSIKVSRNVSIGTLLLNLAATTENDGNIKYKLNSNPDNLFKLNEGNGDLFIAKLLDDKSQKFELKIIAENEYGSASTNLIVIISDHYPIFSESSYCFEVSSNDLINDKLVGVVKVIYYGSVIYKLDDQTNKFSINENSGEIKYEVFKSDKNIYEISVHAETIDLIPKRIVSSQVKINFDTKCIKTNPLLENFKLTDLHIVLICLAFLVLVATIVLIISVVIYKKKKIHQIRIIKILSSTKL